MKGANFNRLACLPSHLLPMELQQSADEGKDVSSFMEEVATVTALPDSVQIEREQRAAELFGKIQTLPVAGNYRYSEPSAWDELKATCEPAIFQDLPSCTIKQEILADKLHGAVLGKCIGCLLGKPIEGWQQNKIRAFLKDTDNFPIHKYLFDSISNAAYEQYGLSSTWTFPVAGMPEDDDVNYLLLGFKTIEQFGLTFQPFQVAETWTRHVPLLYFCTAERIAYRNFTNGIYPPESSWFCNPYREWIGAQIRADVYGYVCPGNPLLAMELAWKDASISHVKNGIYGSMWVAVMLALLFSDRSWEDVIEQSLNYIPKKSRFSEAISQVLHSFQEGVSLQTMLLQIHSVYSETNIHHWCHVLPNAMVVATALLWGRQDFLTSLQITIEAGFDTDSNGATVGSLMGYLGGASAIPDYWKNALQNTIFSPVVGMNEVNIERFANALLGVIYK